MQTELDHLHLRCADLEAAVRFYVDVFGAEVEGETVLAGMPTTRINLGGTSFSLSPPREGVEIKVAGDEPGWGLYQIGLKVKDLDRAQADLAAKGVTFSRGPVQINDQLRVAFLDGPDGVEIELMQFS